LWVVSQGFQVKFAKKKGGPQAVLFGPRKVVARWRRPGADTRPRRGGEPARENRP
jgi:hypothetical protein